MENSLFTATRTPSPPPQWVIKDGGRLLEPDSVIFDIRLRLDGVPREALPHEFGATNRARLARRKTRGQRLPFFHSFKTALKRRLLYDHHVPNLSEKLTETQHVAGAMVLAATHVHLDHHYCLR
jgi:hypothetical protein